MLTADELIALLDLRPLPLEGGHFRETYRSADVLPAAVLPSRYGRDKAAGTAIYYLLTPDTCSALHRLPTDEVFHFYLGDPVQMLQLHPDGHGDIRIMGPDLRAGQRPQAVVPRGAWQGSYLLSGGAFALLGTTMAPGFDFTDYEAGDRVALTRQYPDFSDLIHRLTPD
jgi:predicted cupin superfamily sugar epimerase